MARRFTPPLRAEYDEAQREFYDRFTTGSRADPSAPFRLFDAEGELTGPPSVWVVSIEAGTALANFGYQMRWGIEFSEAAREAAILAVGHVLASPFELYAHVPAALAVGLTEADLAAIAEHRVPDAADEEVRAALEVAWEILDSGTLSDASYAAALDVFGLRQLFQLVSLVSYYRMVATHLAVFGILPPD